MANSRTTYFLLSFLLSIPAICLAGSSDYRGDGFRIVGSDHSEFKDMEKLQKLIEQLPTMSCKQCLVQLEVEDSYKDLKDINFHELNLEEMELDESKKRARLALNFHMQFVDKDGKYDEELFNSYRSGLLNKRYKKVAGTSFTDVFMRGVAGKNWKAIEDFRPDSPAGTLAGIALITGGNALGKQLEKSIEQSLGTVFHGSYTSVSSALTYCYRKLRSKLFGYTGHPFIHHEVICWRESVSNMLGALSELAKKASALADRSSSKILRNTEAVEESISPEWEGQLTNDIHELEYIAESIAQCIGYYNSVSDRAIIHYARQIHDLLMDIKRNILSDTKSYRDLGTTDRQTVLVRQKGSIDKYFDLLLKHVAPDANSKNKMSSASMSPRPIQRSKSMMDHDDF